MTYDVGRVRSWFPSLADGVARFDGPGGSQTPRQVAEAVAATMTAGLSNRGSVTAGERAADEVVLAARQAVADLVGANPAGVVFGRSMTSLAYLMARTLAHGWGPGDEVVVTRLDHDADIRPWVQAAEAAGATVRWVEFDRSTAELTVDHVRQVLSERTRLVAVTGASNLLGSRPDVPAIAAAAHAVGALVHVDAVHLTAHAPVDLASLGADLLTCSPYKFFGPHHGALVADPKLLETLRPDKLAPASDSVPERFELGTLPYELLAGTTAAVDVIADLLPGPGTGTRRERVLASMSAVEAYEDELLDVLLAGLDGIDGLTVHGAPPLRTPTVLLTLASRSSREVYEALAARAINAPASNFYALEASRWMGLGDGGGVRVGLAPYTTADEVDRLLTALAELA